MVLSSLTIALWSGGLITGWWLSRFLRGRGSDSNRLPLPPGPKGYPIIDNLFDMPTDKSWQTFDKWSKIYGDMVFFKILGQPFLVLGSVERTYDLFEKRSSNYSDRPRFPMFNELMDFTWNMAFRRYGSQWRSHRRAFHDYFHPNVVHNYHSAQITTIRTFLRCLLKSPDDFMHHIRHAFTSTILKLTYGMNIPEDDDCEYVKIAEIVMAAHAETGHLGSFLVDLFPSIKHIPAWFPGAGWKRKANSWRELGEYFAHTPWITVREQLKQGTAEPCIAVNLIEKLPDETSPDRTEEEVTARNTCAVAFAGGADTTVSTIQSFFMAMALYPQAQKKAQEELDRVIGNRLPEFNDRPNLPYINAMVKESLRWQLVTPLAVTHMATEADEYNGYYIPKGTAILGNSWSILHDPEAYKDPFVYNPERFLKDGKIDPAVRDPTVAAFGYGRRICPGRFFAQNSLFIFICHILAVYDIRPALDDDGKELEIKPEMTNGLISYPVPFSCRITPRSEKAETLIHNTSLVD